MAVILGIEDAARIAQDEVEKGSCLEGAEATNYGCGVLDGYELGRTKLAPMLWTEESVRETVRQALRLRDDDDDAE